MDPFEDESAEVVISPSSGTVLDTGAVKTDSRSPLALVVDDDPVVRMLVRESLVGSEMEVLEAEDGKEALTVFRDRQPDIILLDVIMPGKDGFATCRELRAMPQGRHVPVLMMTGLDDVESIRCAFEAGATDFTTKPINYALLPHRVTYLHRAGTTLSELHLSEQRLAAAQDMARLGSWELDLESGALSVSESVLELLGLDPGAHVGDFDDLLLNVPPEERMKISECFRRGRRSGTSFRIEHAVVLPDGTTRSVYQEAETCTSVLHERPILMGTVQDVTERRNAERKIFDLSHFDPLTGLPNRSFLRKQLEFALGRARKRGSRLGLLSLDLDKFKRINDTLGHEVGDEVLRLVAKRLSKCQVVGDRGALNTVARLAADEFGVLLPMLPNSDHATAAARAIQEAVAEPIEIGPTPMVLSSSIGVAMFPEHGGGAENLLKNAGTALHLAKQEGGNKIKSYAKGMDGRARRSLTLENELRMGLRRQEFELHYQPKVDLRDGSVTGIEALIRWKHPTRGIVLPAEFIALAEESDLIRPLSDWVLRNACQQAKRLQTLGYQSLPVAVNLSAKQFEDRHLVSAVLDVAERTGLDPRYLELEVTESILMADPAAAAQILNELQEAGVSIALDDFGTGYSSLGHLNTFPFDVVKIDRSFIKDITTNSDSEAIVAAILTMSNVMKRRHVVEGVETLEQARVLRKHGCIEAQGFLFGRPLPAPELEKSFAEPQEGVAVAPIEGRVAAEHPASFFLAPNRTGATLLAADKEQSEGSS